MRHPAGEHVAKTDPASLKDRYHEVLDRVAVAAKRSGRDPRAVIVVAVSKYAGIEGVRELVSMGHRDFGENLVASLLQRAAMVEEWQNRHRTLPSTRPSRGSPPPDSTIGPAPNAVRWHMIGHLQRNKARKAIELCRLVHSVDSLRLGEEIQAIANRLGKTVDVLVQVNTSGEESKFGCAPAAAVHLIEQIETMINVRVRGLMTMAPYSDNPEDARPTFERCRELYEEIRKSGPVSEHFNILSMGMSGDYEVAISEGANLVRIGGAIFGPRAEGQPEEPTPQREAPEE